MRVFKTKEFARIARREKMTDTSLCEAVARAQRGIIDGDLTGGLIKQRLAKSGQGRSGGWRTLIAYQNSMRGVFVYGFAKNERANISKKELEFWRTVAASLLALSEQAVDAAAAASELIEVMCDDEENEERISESKA